ncbi:extracellular solute-binding protein [Paenibacillus sp. SC116]|uniref:extracellular solute-binding protein n=1 Tax=Paenibacillus sp. SC116 TaxID=2968986 RepID=UPI00215A4E56|nr:extracellular solute-binding protein [Paenibacillus sp. SC116]MCR8843236.1 extracellular solute-binding protein [Paenibacillus sp. SC116]
MRRNWMIVLTLLIVVTMFAGCSGDKEATGVKGAEGDSVKLSLWHNFTGDDLRARTMREIISEFETANPNIKLNVQAIPPDGYRARLKTVAAANEMPDVFIMWPGAMTKEFQGGNLIQPVDDLLQANAAWKDDFLPASFDNFTISNKVYSAPMSLTPTSILYYNQSILDKHGVKVPQTWDELLHAVRTLKAANVTPIALGNKAAWLAQSSILSSLADRVTGTEWFLKAAAQDGAKFTDPEFVRALELLQQLQQEGAFQEGFNSMDNTQMEMMFAHGQAAMMIDGGWALTNLTANATPDAIEQMGVTVLPAIAGGKGDPNTTSGVVGVGLGLSAKTEGKVKEAAHKLIYAMSGPEAQKRTLEANQLVSYKVELDKSKVSPIFSKVYELVNDIQFTPVYDGFLTSAGADVVNNGIQELLMGGDPKEIAAKIQEAQAKSLGK